MTMAQLQRLFGVIAIKNFKLYIFCQMYLNAIFWIHMFSYVDTHNNYLIVNNYSYRLKILK